MAILDFTPGSSVGPYTIVARIGTGGMAEVYLATLRDSSVPRKVAIKRLLPTFAHEPRFVDMFAAEARLAATLHHPNIAKVFDVGLHDDACYFAMELVHGHDVRALLAAARAQARSIPLPIAISIMYGVTCALAYVQDPRGIHKHLNVVHRDISPSNILVSFDGAIKLVDFGIARVETGVVTRTASGQLKGKVPYMSPEQCRARPLDGRSDLFSLGVVLYELTTNQRPFDRDSEFDTLEAIVGGEYPRPSKLVPGYPADVEEIVDRLLATRPKDRYPSANAVLLDLDGVIAKHGLDLSNEALAAHVVELLGKPKPLPDPEETERTTPARPAIDRKPTRYEVVEHAVPPKNVGPSRETRERVDRITARADALLEQIAPGTSDPRDLSADAVAKLVGKAMRSHSRGDRENAVIAAELALSAGRPEAGIDALIAANDSLFRAVFDAFLGDQARMAALSQHLEQLVGLAIDQRAAFLLTRIDGNLSARELIATCGLPRREASRHLCQLVLRELVVLV